MRQIKASLFLIVLARAALAGDRPATAQEVIAAAEQEGKLVIYSTTDTIFVGPLLKAEDVPHSHACLAKSLSADPAKWRGKVASYDPERSGIGFLLITQDSRLDPDFAATARAYGAAGVKLYTSIGAMLERIQSGE